MANASDMTGNEAVDRQHFNTVMAMVESGELQLTQDDMTEEEWHHYKNWKHRKWDAGRKGCSRAKRKQGMDEEEIEEDRSKSTERKRKYRAQKRQKDVFIARKSLDTFDELTVNTQDVGDMNHVCSACGALTFKGEKYYGKLVENQPTATFSLCCSDGDVKLPPIKDPPQLLQSLLTGKTHRDRNFHQNIRAYNSSLAFAALGLTGQEYKFRTAGPYCYHINGQLYHTISQLQPETGKPPGFSQIYDI